MTKVTQAQIKGNQGEALVSYLLSKFCLVRPVSGGTDIGVDLYCESITDDQPNNHFWVQVKASGKALASINLKEDKLLYWWRQPVPVFVFLVTPEINYESQTFSINVINITEAYFRSHANNHLETTLATDFVIDSLETMNKFINQVVPGTAARQWLKDGIILPSKPKPSIEYIQYYPAQGCHQFAKETLKFIGRSASMLLGDIMANSQLDQEFFTHRTRLEKILEAFSDYGNWDMHYNLALSKAERHEFKDAKRSFEKALECIESDSILNQDDWTTIKADIKARIMAINLPNPEEQ